MATNLLGLGVPKRLSARGGVWALEISRLLPIGAGVFRPTKQWLSGTDAILKYLNRCDDGMRLIPRATELLMLDPSGSFEVQAGEWIELKGKQNTQGEEVAASERASLEAQLMEMRAEFVRLANAHQSLRQRVSDLEARIEAAELQGVSFANQQEVEEAPEEEAPEEEVVDDGFPGAQRMVLPAEEDANTILQQLIGSDAGCNLDTKPLKLKADSKALFMSRLLDDDDVEVGAIIMDAKSTIFLGGNLLMIPEDELKGMSIKNEPSEDAVAASSEVCNALSGLFNHVPDNPHIRSTPLVAANLAEHDWVLKASERMNLVDTFGGKLLLLGR